METTRTETLTIEGMSCTHCVNAVRQALQQVPSVEVHRVEIGSAEITYDPRTVHHDQLVSAVEEEGFVVK